MFKFPPKIHNSIKELLDKRELLQDIINCYGSPCNILLPSLMDENITSFRNAFSEVTGKIFFAHKCNKSAAVVKQCLKNKINIDVASYNELKSALSNGFTGDKIEATGPKNSDFITLGLQHNIIFNVDSYSELESIVALQKKLEKKSPTKILLRFNDFHSEGTKIINKASRFGSPTSAFKTLIKYISQNHECLNLIGLSFHLDTVSLNEKVVAIENSLKLFEELFELGFNPYVLDIGGGFKVNYISDKESWNEGISELKEDILSGRNQLTWNGKTFGLSVHNHTLQGALNIYQYYDENAGASYLSSILNSKLTTFQGRSIAQILSENMIELYIEPGKSLLDNVGINLAKVTYIKEGRDGTPLVGLDMKRSDLVIGTQELFVDPVLITDSPSSPSGVFFLGNLCMENDLIFSRKVFLCAMPKAGDIVAFINTAGYSMDFEQSETIMQNTAKKVIIDNGKLYHDESYNPFRL